MRDSLTCFGTCLHGEPTGDETPLDDWQPPYLPDRPCRRCGVYTSLSSRVCIECELNRADPPAVVLPMPTRIRLAA